MHEQTLPYLQLAVFDSLVHWYFTGSKITILADMSSNSKPNNEFHNTPTVSKKKKEKFYLSYTHGGINFKKQLQLPLGLSMLVIIFRAKTSSDYGLRILIFSQTYWKICI